MEPETCAKRASESYRAAWNVALSEGRFSQKAERIRTHMRAATASLIRYAVGVARQRDGLPGQGTFPWFNRGPASRPAGQDPGPRDLSVPAEPAAAEGEGLGKPHLLAADGKERFAERRPVATAAAEKSWGDADRLPVTSKKLPRGVAERLTRRRAARH